MASHFPSRRAALVALAFGSAPPPLLAAERNLAVGDATFVSRGLVGVGRIPAATRDSFGETFGSGSGMAFVQPSWHRTATGYAGTLLLLPDRGYNVDGTTDYHARVNTVDVTFAPLPPGAVGGSQDQVRATLASTMLLVDERGEPFTGLDPVGVSPAQHGRPPLPQSANGHVSIDTEAIARLPDGQLFISDEYGPYVYRFSAEGRLLGAIAPPAAFLPRRRGTLNFSSNNPGPGVSAPEPKQPDTGRQNNQGFEGTALTPDGRQLVSVLQSATRQDGGDNPTTRRYTRALVWDVSDVATPKLAHEYVVPLPVFRDSKGAELVAAQSELLALGRSRFLLLCRDTNNGYGQKGEASIYRRIEILDLSGATDIAGSAFDGSVPVAPRGVLAAGVMPATLTPLIDLNENAELGRFGLRNGAPKDRDDLSEKWEAMSAVPALDPDHPDDFFLFVANDNDFVTQDGFQAGAAYKDASGAEVDTMFLVYRVTLPALAAATR